MRLSKIQYYKIKANNRCPPTSIIREEKDRAGTCLQHQKIANLALQRSLPALCLLVDAMVDCSLYKIPLFTAHTYFLFTEVRKEIIMRITYLCPSINTPIGGIKVIYRHAEILTSLGFDSAVFHPDDHAFRCSWFQNNTRHRDAGVFDPKVDFVIIPEIWVGRFGPRLVELGIGFAIFV